MFKLLISIILLFNIINFSDLTKDAIKDTINTKLDEVLLEIKDGVNREIVKKIFNTMKLIDFPLELGDFDMYVEDKPFVEERIRQNFEVIGLLSTQINENLLRFINQVFKVTEPEAYPKKVNNNEDEPTGSLKATSYRVKIINMTELRERIKQRHDEIDKRVEEWTANEPKRYKELMEQLRIEEERLKATQAKLNASKSS